MLLNSRKLAVHLRKLILVGPAPPPHRWNLFAGPLASVSDFVFSASHPQVLMGAITTTALLGYHISVRAEPLKDLTELTVLNFRSAYSPAAAYEFFDALGPQGDDVFRALD